MVFIPSWNWGGYSGGRGGGWAASGFASVARDGVYVGMTALGAALVFLTKEIKRWVLDAILGFAGGVMIVASYFAFGSGHRAFGGQGCFALDTSGGRVLWPEEFSCGLSTGCCHTCTLGIR